MTIAVNTLPKAASTAASPNITSSNLVDDGTACTVSENLVVTGTSSLDATHITTDGSGNITATSYTGSGAGLTDVPGGLIVGEIRLFGMSVPSANFLADDGSPVSRATYASLFGVIGTTFGVGNGTTTFNLPNFQDNVAVGAGNTYSLAATGGSATHTLSAAESGIPAAFSLTVTDPTHYHGLSGLSDELITGGDSFTFGSGSDTNDLVGSPPPTDPAYTGITVSTGAGQAGGSAFSLIQPYLAVNFGICYQA